MNKPLSRSAATRLVNEFNELFPEGSKVKWRETADSPYKEYTVRRRAFIADSGMAVVFFNEKSGYCSIYDRHVAYHLGRSVPA